MTLTRLIGALSALLLAAASTAARPSLYVASYEPGPAWRHGEPLLEQPGFAGHTEHLQRLAQEGSLVSGGPFASMDSGLAIFQAESLDEARRHAIGDPFVVAGALRVEVRQWRPALGTADWRRAAPASEEEAANADRVMELLHALVGKEWIHDGAAPDGSPFLVRNALEVGPDGESILALGWLGGADGMFYHGLTTIHRRPRGGVWFQNVNELGAVASGPITLRGDDTIVWDWLETASDGTQSQYRVEMTIHGTSPDSYAFRLYGGDAANGAPLVDIIYEGVETPPAKFTRLRAEEPSAMSEIETSTNGAVTVRAKREGADRWSSFEVVVPASQAEVWDRLTTEEGMITFFAPEANVEVRRGGPWEAIFFPDAPPGSRGAEGVRFLAIDAPHSFSVQWNAPPKFPEVRKEGFPADFELEPIDHATTRVRLRLHGFKQGEQWDGTYDYFLSAWPVVLNRLHRSYLEGPIDWKAEYGG